MAEPSFIDDPSECSAEWFSAALDEPVHAVDLWREGQTMGSRFGHFRVDGHALFVKMSRGRPATHLVPFIENEFWFYRSIRAAIPTVPTARFVHGRIADDGRYFLILEDLSPRLVSNAEQADRQIVRCLAELHRSTWQHAALDRFPPPGEWRDRVRGRTEAMCADLDLPRRETVRLITLVDHPCWASVHERLATGTHVSLQHCDPHPGNFCFLDDGSACLIDWQRVGVGLPTDDLAHWAVFHGGASLREELAVYRASMAIDGWDFDADFRASVVRAGLILGAFWVGGRRGADLIACKERVFEALDAVDDWLA